MWHLRRPGDVDAVQQNPNWLAQDQLVASKASQMLANFVRSAAVASFVGLAGAASAQDDDSRRGAARYLPRPGHRAGWRRHWRHQRGRHGGECFRRFGRHRAVHQHFGAPVADFRILTAARAGAGVTFVRTGVTGSRSPRLPDRIQVAGSAAGSGVGAVSGVTAAGMTPPVQSAVRMAKRPVIQSIAVLWS